MAVAPAPALALFKEKQHRAGRLTRSAPAHFRCHKMAAILGAPLQETAAGLLPVYAML